MTYQIKKIINHDTHNVYYTLPGTFADRVRATRAIKHLWRAEADDECAPEHCYKIVDIHGREVSFVYPTGPFVPEDQRDYPF